MISHLDYLMSLPQVHREVYGYCEDEKPNDHCVWTDIGYSQSIMAWVENDAHLRERINGIREKLKERESWKDSTEPVYIVK